MPLSAVHPLRDTTNAPLAINHQGQFPVVTLSFNLAPGVSLGEAVDAIRTRAANRACPPSIQASFQGTAQAFQNSLANEPLLILAALVTVYIVLGVLYESYIHPDHDPLDAALRRRRRDAGAAALGQRLHVIALIGIILLIGIVKKNAIMMIDFALEAERDRRQNAARSDLPGVPAALPADHDDHDGGAAGRLPLALGTGTGRSCAVRWVSRSWAACLSARC